MKQCTFEIGKEDERVYCTYKIQQEKRNQIDSISTILEPLNVSEYIATEKHIKKLQRHKKRHYSFRFRIIHLFSLYAIVEGENAIQNSLKVNIDSIEQRHNNKITNFKSVI